MMTKYFIEHAEVDLEDETLYTSSYIAECPSDAIKQFKEAHPGCELFKVYSARGVICER